MTEEYKIDADSAEREFDRFVEEMDLDLDTSDMDKDDLTAFNKLKRLLIRNIQRGHLVINDDGEAVYTPHRKGSGYKEPITFHERTGASLMATDSKKKGHDASKTYAMMGDMCKVHQKVFAGLQGTDIKVCEAIFQLLMD